MTDTVKIAFLPYFLESSTYDSRFTKSAKPDKY